MTKEERVRLYVERTPIAVSGNEGSRRTMAVARTLYDGFELSESDTLYWLTKFSDRCQPPWNEKQLKHKVKSTVTTPGKHGRGWMNQPVRQSGNGQFNGHSEQSRPPIMADYIQAVEYRLGNFRCTESDLYDASPIKPAEDFHKDGVVLLEHLFNSGEQVNFVLNFKINKRASGLEKADPNDSGVTEERDQIVRIWKVDGVPFSDAGGWLRINPVLGGITDQHVTSLRHMLVEFDKIPIEFQISFFARFKAPICAILTSGGSSIHAWLKVNCATRPEFDALFLKVQNHLSRFGMDSQNKNPARLSRLPGAIRKITPAADGRQRLLYLNPNPEARPIIP